MKKLIIEREKISPFLADTWWYGITKRISDEEFLALVKKRKLQGFNAAQIEVGIPPEVGCYNESAKSKYGTAWDMKGNINYDYLSLARKRIELMCSYGIKPIIYGAWGYQIDWIGTKNMCRWWKSIIEFFDDLDVIYCVTGESDLWTSLGASKNLLPDKTSKNITVKKNLSNKILKTLYKTFTHHALEEYMKNVRRKKWNVVLQDIANSTKKPLLIHTTPSITGVQAIKDPNLISANTFQTGHTHESEKNIWKFPLESKKSYTNLPVINLEPWYEGILDDFYEMDQMNACWLSVSAGAISICYGAHGIWNVGNGVFLSQWGNQTFSEGLELETPCILGKTFALLNKKGVFQWKKVEVKQLNNRLESITRVSENGEKMTYIPNIKECSYIPLGKILDVRKVEIRELLPTTGPVVIFHF